MRRKQPKIGDYSEMFCPRSEEERFASMMGQTAMSMSAYLPAGKERLNAMHMLRVAARKCPGAAYNLGNYLSVWKDGRPRRYDLATDTLITTVEMAKARIADTQNADDSWPDSEYFVRDVGSRALTDLGARISNIGNPKEAVVFFRDAIRMFRGNSNAWVCLGNMGIYFSHETGVDTVEGIEAWKMAYSMGDPESDVDGLESDRRNAVAVMEDAIRLYGREVLDQWVEDRLLPLLKKQQKGLIQLRPLAMHPSHLGKVTGKPWTNDATMAGAVIGGIVRDGFPVDMNVEEKVTIAASLLLSILNRRAKSDAEKKLALTSAMSLCEDFEPLWPLLGDEEWETVGLPETEYLTSLDAKDIYSRIVSNMIESVLDHQPDIRAVDAAAGVLFNLDSGFRRGVTSMISPQIGKMIGPLEYLPAIYVGGARHAPSIDT
ncbi:hypothetical protein G6L37_06750 [Agrobacterium rubi]|nr:hypothetical protein [Agrobacterium rubi]NTF25063.1 hypothetical protein [Agrobacterium rubi]